MITFTFFLKKLQRYVIINVQQDGVLCFAHGGTDVRVHHSTV